MKDRFSIRRLLAIIIKEFIHMKRDRLTFAMIIGLPLMQLILFGFAINSNPKNLPTALVIEDYSYFTRQVLRSFLHTQYFKVIAPPMSETQADKLLSTGKAQFILKIPSYFSEELVRGERPNILLTADATEAIASSNALAAAHQLPYRTFAEDQQGALSHLNLSSPPFNIIVHAKYNPELITQYAIVPGLIGFVLTMTLVVIAAQVLTRERERGTLESLLATPAHPFEVIIGKILPFIVVGYIQVLLLILAAIFIFKITMMGNFFLLLITVFPFMAANLSVGITFSAIADNQLQGVQMAVFFMLPSILLSGFMFPFYGMPQWAQGIGSLLPLTYFLRIVRGIILKGNGLIEIWPNIWPMLIFVGIALIIGITRYRQTLD